MKIKHTYTHLIKLSGTLLFTDKGTFVPKQKISLKLDSECRKPHNLFSCPSLKSNKNQKITTLLHRIINFS